jgi:4-diphosphocytidyl-2-C-methyl-D-erythritol kinase
MLSLKAPAKINWFLNVRCKRSDGYHEISSLMQCLTLGDSLTFEDADDIDVSADLPIPREENLVYKAALLMRERCGIRKGVRITLKKEIPLAAGLGGGSSDAAYTMRGLNDFWGLTLTPAELADLGSGIGSDVPFFFHGPAALIEGRGERVTPVALKRSCTLLLVKPPTGISAAWAYGQMKAAPCHEALPKRDSPVAQFCRALDEGNFSFLSSLQSNDLEPPVLREHPVIGEIKEELRRKGALFSSMSGSGSTVFGVFASDEDAGRAAADFSPYWCRAARTLASEEK